MKRGPDPAWIRATVGCYRACLYLYPARVRARHGEDMLQVLRDRCREADAAGRGRLRMLALEILPDAVRSAGASHWSAGIGEPSLRHFLQLGLLLALAGVMLFRDPVDRWVIDRASAASHAWSQWSSHRTQEREEAQLRDFAQALAAGDARERLLSAYLHRSLAEGRRFSYPEMPPTPLLAADGARGRELLRDLPRSRDPWMLALAVQACGEAAACDRGERVRELLAVDAGNGYAWSLAFREAARRQDDAAMAGALAAMARSSHYDDYLARTRHELVAAAVKAEPRTDALLAPLGRRMQEARWLDLTDYRNEVRMACTPASVPWNPGAKHWIDSHPRSVGDCLAVAKLMSTAGSLWPAEWGARLVAHMQPSDQAAAEQERAWFLFRVAANPGSARRPDGSWRQWTDEEWIDWSRLWLQEGSEREIAARQARD